MCACDTGYMGSHGFTAARYLHWIAHGGVPAVHSSSLHDTEKLGGHHRKDEDKPHACNLTEGKGGTSVASIGNTSISPYVANRAVILSECS